MKIGIVVAIFAEMKALLDNLHADFHVEDSVGFKTYIYKLNNNEIYVCESRAGEISATQTTQFLITKYDVELILNFGICGGLKKELGTTKACLVNKVVHYDIDTSPIDNVPRGQYYFLDDKYLKPSDKILDFVRSLNLGLKDAICASGDKFVEKQTFKDELVIDFDADICDMEIAGIALTCIRNEIDFISVKVVSDAYQGDGNQYELMKKDASFVAFKILKEIIDRL